MSTWFFDYVSDLIRERLAGRIPGAALAEIYHGKDEAFLSLIALDDQPADVFHAFYIAAIEARALDTKFADHALWDEILDKTRADSRWRTDP